MAKYRSRPRRSRSLRAGRLTGSSTRYRGRASSARRARFRCRNGSSSRRRRFASTSGRLSSTRTRGPVERWFGPDHRLDRLHLVAGRAPHHEAARPAPGEVVDRAIEVAGDRRRGSVGEADDLEVLEPVGLDVPGHVASVRERVREVEPHRKEARDHLHHQQEGPRRGRAHGPRSRFGHRRVAFVPRTVFANHIAATRQRKMCPMWRDAVAVPMRA